MPANLIYFTGLFNPEFEGVSKELALLQEKFGGWIYGINSEDYLRFSIKKKVFCHYGRPYRVAYSAVKLIEKFSGISHIYHNFSNRYFLGRLSKRPIVLTGAAGGDLLPLEYYRDVSLLVAESETDRQRLLDHGISAEQVQLIYPGVDLAKWFPRDSADDFTVLFASSPFDESYFEARGVPILIEAAKLTPGIRYKLLWRNWGRTSELVRKMAGGLSNVDIITCEMHDVRELFRAVHAVVLPFTSDRLVKPCPNSLIEGLACGKPILCSKKVQVSSLIEEEKAGIIFEPHAKALADSARELAVNWGQYKNLARRCAEKYFSKDNFLASYSELYNGLRSKF